MKHQYHISGITCSGCVNTIKNKLYRIPGINEIDIEQASGDTSITMEKHVSAATLQQALSETKYKLEEAALPQIPAMAEQPSGIWATYRPVILLFGLIALVSLVIQLNQPEFVLKHFLMHFMAGFFISFSFFKLLDVPAFAMSYSNYDVVARYFRPWGYLYPFVELGLGIGMLIPSIWFEANLVALAVMGVSSIGVIQNQFNKSPFKCACLGAVFNLPLGVISLIEDLLMVVLSAWVLFL